MVKIEVNSSTSQSTLQFQTILSNLQLSNWNLSNLTISRTALSNYMHALQNNAMKKSFSLK